MNPKALSEYLVSMAAYIEETPKPSQRVIVAGLQRAVRELQAGKITKFVDHDYAQTMHGLDQLLDRLSKAAQSLNPQNESKAILEHSVGNLQKLKAGLSEEFQELSKVEI